MTDGLTDEEKKALVRERGVIGKIVDFVKGFPLYVKVREIRGEKAVEVGFKWSF